MQENQFTHNFWNEKFSILNQINSSVQNTADSKEDFVRKIEEISKKEGATSYASNLTPSGTVRLSIGMNLGVKINFCLEIAAEPVGKKALMKGAYLELNILHENSKEFLTNTFLPFLPYTSIEELLKMLKVIHKDYAKKILEVKKQAKLDQMTVGLIKSSLTKKFKDSRFDWELSDVDNGNYLIRIKDGTEIVQNLIVNENDCVEKIMRMDLSDFD
ncbi:MAG: hypothetical protein IJ630_04560 [Treponema sp.]|nr:hypothetical protein [Treponema sp.]